MRASDYQLRDGLSLAALLQRGEVSARELMHCALELTQRHAGLNAIRAMDADAALQQAAGSPLRGQFGALPFLLKDSGLACRDLPTSLGSRLFANTPAAADATLTARFRADGFVPFGRTAVPEFSMAPTTEGALYGPAHNPWDATRSAGGSSGGAAAAVAAGIVPIAHGNDGGGSIRIPAACCGVYGLKPSRGLIPIGPARGEGWGGLSADGVLSRTVRDTAAALDGMAGMDLGAPYAAPAIPGRYLDLMRQAFDRKLRIAVWTRAFDDIPVAPDCVAAVEAARALLLAMGHEVVDAPLPPIKYGSFVRAHQDVLATNVTVMVNGKLRSDPAHAAKGSDWEEKLEPAILDGYRIGQTLSAETYALAITRFHTIARQMEVYMQAFDVVLSPTLTQPPARLGVYSTQSGFRSFRDQVARYTAFLAIINASGQPAASLPLYWTAAGLPIGVQLIARFGQEAELLRLSGHLEEAAPWQQRRPTAAAV